MKETLLNEQEELPQSVVGEGLLGRVVTPTGQPLDGKGPIEGELFNLPFERKAPGCYFQAAC